MHGKCGFTLIEMSLVLVIIALIVGGILVGQDLIKAAEARAQISQIEKYNSAVNTFRAKFQAIPGDMAVATANQLGFTVGASCSGIAS
jgi:prepilin-type N-terminal cleavage/methylation domain-containing protein